MKNLIYLASAMMFLIFVQACQDKHGKNYNQGLQDDKDDLVFVKNGLESGLTEVKASGMAITNSRNQRVIQLAKRIIEDHTTAAEGLQKIQSDKKIVENDTINPQHSQMLNDLSKKSGSAFDRAYLQMMVNDHEQAVKLFTAATQSTDAGINKFATQTLPTIKLHLDSANAICIAVK